MSDQLAAMLDRQEITDLTIKYTWLLDHGPHSELSTVFTPDAFAHLGGADCNGIEEIVTMVDRALNSLSISQHIVSNHQVTIDGDLAKCRCYFQAQHTFYGAKGGENYIVAGRYTDEVTRTPDGWRIHHRILTVDWTEGNLDMMRQAMEAAKG